MPVVFIEVNDIVLWEFNIILSALVLNTNLSELSIT